MRYIGNKEKILDKINAVLEKKGLLKKNLVFFDLFSGTGTVGDYYKNIYRIIANDNMWFAYVLTSGKLNITKEGLHFKKLGFDPIKHLNSIPGTKGFIYKNYSSTGGRMYFTDSNAMKIDAIRKSIESWYKLKKIDESQYHYLLACLIESVSKVANIAGVYGAFLKKWDPRAHRDLVIKPLEIEISSKKHVTYNRNAEDIIREIDCDILYLDPPYTKNQYSVQYHLLETIAKYDKPSVKGITGARGDKNKVSSFSKDYSVHVNFEKLIADSRCGHIIVSYSSHGLMSKEFISAVLKRHGENESFYFVKFLNKKYQNHQTKKSVELYEYIFYIKKKKTPIYQTPINYMGNKFKLVEQIKNNLPKDIDVFYDIFGGGFNVGINIDAKKIVYNDINHIVVDLIKNLSEVSPVDLYKNIIKLISKYQLAKNNSSSYGRIRAKYNESKDWVLFFVTMLYGYQQQIRFNSKHIFNNPVGQSGFNDLVLEEIISYNRVAKNRNITFLSKDFEFFGDQPKHKKSFFYVDPPYLITLGSYNDGKRGFNGWNKKEEERLLNFLSKLDRDGHRFMLSNMLNYRGKQNNILLKWIKDNNYKVIKVTTSGMRRQRDEVLVVNY